MAQVHYVLGERNAGAELRRWSLQSRVDWREWDGEFVAHADGTGSTYLLSTLAGETIKALREGAAPIDELAVRVFRETESTNAATASLVATFADSGGETQILRSVLAELEVLGLARTDFT